MDNSENADEVNFYPRPPRGGRPDPTGSWWRILCISIHALREEGDAPMMTVCTSFVPFLSTPSARRATQRWCHQRRPRGISIHALREEGDSGGHMSIEMRMDFYPRPPRGGRR